MKKYLPELLQHIEAVRMHPEKIISHRLPLSQAVEGYKVFNEKRDNCRK